MSKIILGGGIGGLSVAHYLLKKYPKCSISLIEASDRVGGWIKSNTLEDGTIFEQGARTLRPTGEAGLNTLELLEELELTDLIKPITRFHPAASNRLIYSNGELHLLPTSIKGLFVKQKFLSKPLVTYILSDLLAQPKKTDDESLYDFTTRRFGAEIADNLISPMVCGICGGNAKKLSVHFLMSGLFEYEQKYGGVIKGFLINALKKVNKTKPTSKLISQAINERWAIYSFQNGLEVLPLRLNDEIIKNGCDVKLKNECINVDFNKINKTVTLELKNGTILSCVDLISTLPANKIATVVEKQHPELARLFMNIKPVTIAVVNLQYTRKLIKNDAFGFLVAPKENLPILGVIYDTSCFPQGDKTVLTVMLGGYWFNEHFGDNPSDDLILQTALQQLKKILGVTDEPECFKVNILKNCISQYNIGHKANLKCINDYIKTNQLNLSICGSSFYGVGINDVILSAKKLINNF